MIIDVINAAKPINDPAFNQISIELRFKIMREKIKKKKNQLI